MFTLFTYGTLEIPKVMETVTGASFPATGAVLANYARFLLHGEIYPGILREDGSEVAGVLYEEVDRESLALLDLFEGDFYRREKVRVTTMSRRQVDTHVYVVRPRHPPLVSSQPWDRNAFISRHLEGFLPYCLEFRSNQTRTPGSHPNPG